MGANHTSAYAKQLIAEARKSQVVLAGYMNEDQLNHLYTYARLFVLPSFNEGYPIVLVEAINYQKPILASNIEANRSIGLAKDQYFKVGSVSDLKDKIENELNKEYKDITYNINIPTWKEIANLVAEIYSNIAP